MLNDFFVNVLLLVSVTFIGGHIIKEVSTRKMNTLPYRVLTGVFCGVLGVFLIIYSVPIDEAHTLIDLRVYAVMIASFVGGLIPMIISGIIIAIFRILLYEDQSPYIVIIVQLVSFIISFYIIDKFVKIEWKRWMFKIIISLFVIIVTYYYVLKNIEDALITLSLFSSFVIFTGILEYFLLEYVKISNDLYRKYKMDSTKDFLTGLTNTRQFDKVMNLAFDRVQQNKESLTCMMIDIDFFKKVNDTYGHAIGDLVLKELAEVIIKCVRTTDVIARVGGEEFCALLFNCAKEQSFEIALGINKAVQEHQFPIGDNQYINITVSVGVSIYPEMTTKLDTLKELADTALYQAKRSGRNRICNNEVCITNQDGHKR